MTLKDIRTSSVTSGHRPLGVKLEPRPTMSDIAAEAGVSQMTVSRVLRGTGQTSHAVQKRVENAARKLGYVPNRLATALRDETTPLVAVALATLGNRVFSEVLNGINETLCEKRLQPVFGVTEYSLEREEELVRDLLSWRPRGIILSGLEHSDATRTAIRASGVRVAEIMDLDGTPISAAFGLSQTEAGCATARYMLSKGYRRFSYLGSQNMRDLRADKRLAGFRRTISEAGAQMVKEHILEGPSSMLAGKVGTARLLDSKDRTEAIYYSNDDLAAGGIMHCLATGISIPDELALAGFNGLSFLDSLPIRLTTVQTPRHEMGRRAAHFVTQDDIDSENSDPQLIDLGFTLIKGETC